MGALPGLLKVDVLSICGCARHMLARVGILHPYPSWKEKLLVDKAKEHAEALGRLGAAKGGKARANNLSPEERSEIARNAAQARWGDTLPRAIRTGTLVIAGREISCAVLENGTRLLTQESFLTTIGRNPKAKGGTGSSIRLAGGLPPFLAAENLQPFISDELKRSLSPLAFRNERGVKSYGYEATVLPMVCEVYLRARDQKGVIRATQRHIVEACDLLMRGLATVGIIALVDEATGYQEDRAKDELQRILEAYIAPELMPWTKMFPDEFFKQMYRLQGWAYKPGTAKRTQYVGKLINKYVYDKLPPGVLAELRSRNPVTEKGYRKHKHHQFLTAETGNKHLDKQIATVTTLMRVSDSKAQFQELFDRAFPNEMQQQRLPLVVEVKGGKAS